MTNIRRVQTLVLLMLLGCAAASHAIAADPVVLRVVPHADLKILDPHTNTATITLMHGQMLVEREHGVPRQARL